MMHPSPTLFGAGAWLFFPRSRAAAWSSALAEHEREIAGYVRRMEAVPRAAWAKPRADGRWHHAAEALHVVMAYELCVQACREGRQMRLVVSPLVAWASRTVLLPLFLHTRTFPRNARAPREVRPDMAVAIALSREELVARLQGAAHDASHRLHEADGLHPPFRLMHAYFGALPPLTALRLLSAHTRHHTTVGLARITA